MSVDRAERLYRTSPPLPFVLGGFGCIIADPPWSYDDDGSRIRTPYETMTARDLLELPIAALAADKGYLFLWATSSFTELGYRVVRAWGFEPKSQMVWVKRAANGGYRFGMGHHLRLAHEIVIVGSRGGQTGLVRDIHSVIDAPRAGHSVKPEELYSICERLAPGPRLELFARRRRVGWASWGDELPAREGDDHERRDGDRLRCGERTAGAGHEEQEGREGTEGQQAGSGDGDASREGTRDSAARRDDTASPECPVSSHHRRW